MARQASLSAQSEERAFQSALAASVDHGVQEGAGPIRRTAGSRPSRRWIGIWCPSG